MSSKLSAGTAFRAKRWKTVSNELQRPTAKGGEGRVAVEGWEIVVNAQARQMLNTAVNPESYKGQTAIKAKKVEKKNGEENAHRASKEATGGKSHIATASTIKFSPIFSIGFQ